MNVVDLDLSTSIIHAWQRLTTEHFFLESGLFYIVAKRRRQLKHSKRRRRIFQERLKMGRYHTLFPSLRSCDREYFFRLELRSSWILCHLLIWYTQDGYGTCLLAICWATCLCQVGYCINDFIVVFTPIF